MSEDKTCDCHTINRMEIKAPTNIQEHKKSIKKKKTKIKKKPNTIAQQLRTDSGTL